MCKESRWVVCFSSRVYFSANETLYRKTIRTNCVFFYGNYFRRSNSINCILKAIEEVSWNSICVALFENSLRDNLSRNLGEPTNLLLRHKLTNIFNQASNESFCIIVNRTLVAIVFFFFRRKISQFTWWCSNWCAIINNCSGYSIYVFFDAQLDPFFRDVSCYIHD